MKSTAYILILITALMSSSCSQDAIHAEQNEEPWEVVETTPKVDEAISPSTPILPEPTAYTFEACSEDFVTGPVWEMVIDKQAARQESRWIAVLGTSRRKQNLTTGNPDYDVQMATLEELFDNLEIDIIDNEQDALLVVSGTPTAIESALRESCLLVGLDLTGFHCDCAPQQCLEAKTCRLYKMSASHDHPKVQEALADAHQTFGLSEAVLGCAEDVHGSVEYVAFPVYDFRGAVWGLSGSHSFVKSWRSSACPTLHNNLEHLD